VQGKREENCKNKPEIQGSVPIKNRIEMSKIPHKIRIVKNYTKKIVKKKIYLVLTEHGCYAQSTKTTERSSKTTINQSKDIINGGIPKCKK